MPLFEGVFISSYFTDIQKKNTVTEFLHSGTPTHLKFHKMLHFFLGHFACN